MIAQQFKQSFGAEPAAVDFTAGRVNLIGEHTDYNGGMVLPTALKIGVTIALSPRKDNQLRIWSDKFDDLAERTLTDPASDHWSDYIVGAIVVANQVGLMQGGADVAITTTLPFGAGISSSAAVTVGVLKLARQLAQSDMSDTDIAVLARRVENDYIGVPCGIMDQMAVAIAQPGQALALDTVTLAYDLVELPDDYYMAVIHSGQHRQLSEGRYKTRKEECDVVKEHLGRNDICQISDEDFENLSDLPENIRRRARHCMTEHRRVLAAITAIKSGDMKKFGQLMIESHASMRDDFENSMPQIDTLVKDAVKYGAIGARMTGGGFGGCTVNLVEADKVEAFTAAVAEQYREQCGLIADFYPIHSDDGMRELTL